jgi:hypothetical protein
MLFHVTATSSCGWRVRVPHLFREGVQEGTGTLRGLVWSVLFKSTGQTVWLAAATTARER